MSGCALDRLAARLGIVARYHQVDGTEHVAGPETLRALLGGLGLAVVSEADAAEHLARIEQADAGRRLAREFVVTAGEAAGAALPQGRLLLEDGGEIAVEGALPPLPPGLHRFAAEGSPEAALVIAAPAAAPMVAERAGRPRVWGVTAALYGLRSARNTGVGDYEDLARLSELLAPHGADFVGINPVHPRGAVDPGLSPYSPSSRTGFDPGHIALDRIPELAGCAEARALLEAAAPSLAAAREAPLVDHTARRAVAEPVLRALHASFEAAGDTPRRAAFEAWRRARPEPHAREAVFEALSLRHGPDWRGWPAALQDPSSPDVAAFAAREAAEIRFHDWLRWLAEMQVAEAQDRAQAAGMALGLYLDIAVGVRPGGAETWANRQAFATGVSLGAPPDLLSAEGQRWNLAPFSPTGLAAEDYAPFRAMLRAAMAHAGAVRIDHVIGFRRSFWVPDCGAPGGYVRFPEEVLLALTRIEAARAGAVVIGEDLGTVPEGLREAMAGSGLHGCAIMPFEREPAGFVAPDRYRPLTLAAFGTHDMPTLAGWWAGRDIALRAALGHLTPEAVPEAEAERARDRALFCHLLRWFALLPGGVDPDAPPDRLDEGLRDAMHALLGSAASALVAVQLDDILGAEEAQNLPGTVDEHPNWRRRAGVALEALAGHPALARTAAILRRARAPGGQEDEETR